MRCSRKPSCSSSQRRYCNTSRCSRSSSRHPNCPVQLNLCNRYSRSVGTPPCRCSGTGSCSDPRSAARHNRAVVDTSRTGRCPDPASDPTDTSPACIRRCTCRNSSCDCCRRPRCIANCSRCPRHRMMRRPGCTLIHTAPAGRPNHCRIQSHRAMDCTGHCLDRIPGRCRSQPAYTGSLHRMDRRPGSWNSAARKSVGQIDRPHRIRSAGNRFS